MELSIIIPCYQSSEVINFVINEIATSLLNHKYEIILIDDGNTNFERENLIIIASQHESVRLESLTANLGQHYATLYGCSYAKGTIICSMDDDGQHNPKDIVKMMGILREKKYDLVYAQFHEHFEIPWRSFIRRAYYLAVFGLGKTNDRKSSFRIWTKEFNEKLCSCPFTNILFDRQCLALEPNIGYTSVNHRPSLLPKSRYSFKQYLRYITQIKI